MEPCLFRHGKMSAVDTKAFGKPLQWSHVFSDMVRQCLSPSRSPRTLLLQWSHVFSDMVRTRLLTSLFNPHMLQWSHVFSDMVRELVEANLRTVDRFNGAMSFQTW